MKIAMPVDDNNLETVICASFARAPYFQIYDTETNESIFVENTAMGSPGGAGIKASQIVVDLKVSALLLPRCGQNAADVLNEAGIKMYKSLAGSSKTNIDAFNKGELSKLEDIHPGFHGAGGR